MLEFKTVAITKPEDVNVIIGQTHFIKTVEDLYEALVNSVPGIKFGLSFNEASGSCKVRSEGTDPELKKLAEDNALELDCGHVFVVMLQASYPINVLNAIKQIPEVCSIFCATANPVTAVIADIGTGRGIMGVVDGSKTKGLENKEDIAWRKGLLRKIGYKL